ncbi:SMP-30/gluconolactonase/LRE family protein [Spongiibacter tropicus]|uniref:SMP-30/gluconolactonase/LRE family protein n=1 Tax=Spongiibacter tropicus TaxID=454602 RepID=UPI003A99903D
MDIFVLDETQCVLGESAFWNSERQSYIWLDILKKRLYEKRHESLACHVFEFTPSAVLKHEDKDCITLVSDAGIATYHLGRRCIIDNLPIKLESSFRTNDAGLDPQGRVVFGSMQWEPAGRNGVIYRLEKDGRIRELLSSIGIPNTFLWSDCGTKIYFADSYLQEMYVAEYRENEIANIQLLFRSNGTATPDGSCRAGKGIFNAEWDGARVVLRSLNDGSVLSELPLRALRPTSCAIAGEKMDELLITTASDGMDDEQMAAFPLSGKTLIACLK